MSMQQTKIDLSEHCYILDWGYCLRLYSYRQPILEYSKTAVDNRKLTTLCLGYTCVSYTIRDFLQTVIGGYPFIYQSHIRMFIKYIRGLK